MVRFRRLAICALALAAFAFNGHSAPADKPRDEMMELYGLFVDAVEAVETHYVKPVDRKQLVESALKSMLSNLDDYSSYMSQNDWRQFRKDVEGTFTGIGVQVDVDFNARRPKIIAPLVGSPAYKAGVMAGDIILEIDGKDTENWTRDQIVEALIGRPGTEVTIRVLHTASTTPVDLTVNRAIIETPSVLGDLRKPDDAWDFMLDKDKKIGYIRLVSFVPTVAQHLKEAIDELKAQGMKALILDLRDNPGGLLSQAVEVSDLFIDGGRIVSTKGRNTQERTYDAQKDGTYDGFPMAVLVNGQSASASEIVAAALQDHKRAHVVGSRTWGKGSVQNILPLDNGNSILRLTIATYWRPSGKNIHRFRDSKESDEWGVNPDPGLEVKIEGRDFVRWFRARQERDMLSSHNPPADGKPAPKLEDKALQTALDTLAKDLNSPAQPAAKAAD
jgi:carboxyl-terminal processing protease